MKRITSLRGRFIGRVAVSLGMGLAMVPFVVGAVGQPAGATTVQAGGANPVGPIVAEIDCAVQWQIYDIASEINSIPNNTPTPGAPFCTDPVPIGL
jgi:hypothetical protein